MFDVSLKGDRIVCVREYRPDADKLVQIKPMRCEVSLPLGIGGDTASAKALLAEFGKTFNAAVVRETRAFERNVEDTRARIVSFLKAHPEHRDRRPSIVVDEEKYLSAMWDKYCRTIAPEVAQRALASAIGKLRARLPDLKEGRARAVGKATVPSALIVLSGAVAAAAAPAAGAALLAAALKVLSGTLRATQDVGKSLQRFRLDQEGLEKDVAALRAATNVLTDRIQRLDQAAHAIRLEIAAITTEMAREEKLVAELERKAGASAAPQTRVLRAKLADRRKTISVLESKIVDTAALARPVHGLKTALFQLDELARRGTREGAEALRAGRDLIDMVKESASIADKLAD